MESELDGTHTFEPNYHRRRKRFYKCLCRIYKTTMIMSILIIVILFLQNGESFNEKQLTQTAALPRKFFPSHGHVTEYHFGNLQPVIKLIEQEELIFVMYYAPWCSESIYVRGEFLRAAKVISSIVKFVAVNCWYPDGECRQHMKFLFYPQLFIYHTGVHDGYKYSGIKEAEYFVKFVESFLFPLKSLHSLQQVEEFTAENDNTVIGYFNFNSSPQPPGGTFHQFYLAAIRILSYDIFQPVKFGVVRTVDLAETIGLTVCNSFSLIRQGNSTLKYPPHFNLTASNITNWVIWNKQKNLSPWLVPPGIKSLTLSLPMQKGPALLVFAPANPLINFYPYLNMVRLAVYAIRSCGNNTEYYSNLLNTYMQTTFTRLYFAKKLHKNGIEKHDMSSSDNKCCMSLLVSSKRMKQSLVCEYCVFKSAQYAGKVCDISLNSEVRSEWFSKLVNSCSDFCQFYNVNEHHSMCCKNVVGKPSNFYRDSVLDKQRKATDSFVTNGKDFITRLHAAKLTLQKIKHLTSLKDLSKAVTKFSDIHDGNITGLHCRSNKTIDFYYIDSVYHSALMERFHVSVASQPSKVSVILVDLANEAVYVLQEKLNYQSLARFVLNYTEGALLTRHRQSMEVVTPKECGSTSTVVCVVDITVETFQSVVMDNNKDVLVYYYAQWCGYSSQFSHIYLTVAQYFKDNDRIIFARVNGDTNDLPWEFTVDSYPTVIFFPAHRKSDSILFPENVAKTVPNLIKFILYHSNQSVQIDMAVGMCTNECVHKNRVRVLTKITELELSITQIQRRAFAIQSQTLINDEHKRYIQSASAALWRSQSMYSLKLRKAQLLNHFLRNNWKQFDKSMMLELIQKSKTF